MITYYKLYHSPIGNIRLRASDEALLALDHVNQQDELEEDWTETSNHPILTQAAKELDEYFSKTRQSFETPLQPKGTEFQKTVWKELQHIPYGTTCSYSDIAEAIGNPNAVRAVGLANGKNPLSIFIPCHRVIGKSGKLVGYGGGLKQKQILLNLEHSDELF